MNKLCILLLLLCSSASYGHALRHFAGTPLEIITIGHPTLRQVAQEIPYADIFSEEMQKFFDDMIATLKKSGGVGLAAPQVNVAKRVFVMHSGRSVPLTVVINPKVRYLEQYGKKNSLEGCLSIPGKRVRVKRFKRIQLDYINRHGDFLSEEATGFKAIIAQHEYDHLNGVMIVDLIGRGSKLVEYKNYVSVPQM